MTTQKKNSQCLHTMAYKVNFSDGEVLVCKMCDTAMRFVRTDGSFVMFPMGGTMTTASETKFDFNKITE